MTRLVKTNQRRLNSKQPLTKLKQVLYDLKDPTPDIIITGDFNLPHTKWPEGIPTPGATSDEKLMINILNNLSDEFFLMQLITEPTHKSGNTLDLILVNNERLVHHYTCSKTNLSISHHSIIQSATLFNVSYKTEKEHKPKLLSPFLMNSITLATK